MLNPEQENMDYLGRIDEITNRFWTEKTFYAKEWVDNLTAPFADGNSPSLCIWGVGSFGYNLYNRFLKKINVPITYFCDNSPQKWNKKVIDQITCINPDALREKTAVRVIIAVNGHEEEITRQCISLGVRQNNIFYAPLSVISWETNYRCSVDIGYCDQMVEEIKNMLDYFETDQRSKELLVEILYRRLIDSQMTISQDGVQYLIPEFPIRENEAFVDAGAYNGDSLLEFTKCLSPDIITDKINYYAFECSETNLEELQAVTQQFACPFLVEIYPYALWDKEEKFFFSDNGSSGTIDTSGAQEVYAKPLDGVLTNRPVTWIKMDIEGAELSALRGAQSIINVQHPRLSICVYHSPEDLYEIPKLIKTFGDYKMLLRHHSELDYETVLYAY